MRTMIFSSLLENGVYDIDEKYQVVAAVSVYGREARKEKNGVEHVTIPEYQKIGRFSES